MKKLLVALLLIWPATTYAQKLYLKPYGGLGLSWINSHWSAPLGTTIVAAPCYTAGINLGFKLRKLRLETGLGYMQTGEKTNYTGAYHLLSSSPTYNVSSTTVRFNHFVLPLLAGYEIKLKGKFYMVPTVGALVSYNAGQSYKIRLRTGEDVRDTNWDLGPGANEISLFGSIALAFEYKLPGRMSIQAAPAFNYMLTDMSKAASNAFFTPNVRPYNMLLNVGVVKSL